MQGIELVLADGREMTAPVQDGFFAAWWNGAALSSETQVTWTTTEGRSTTSLYEALPY